VSATGVIRVEIDGRPPAIEALQRFALNNVGHFTAMQVRDARVRGLALHLARLDQGSRELFGAGLDGQRVRDLARHALADDVRDASLRVIVFESPVAGELCVMITLRPPGGMPERPQTLRAVRHQRTLPHVKHIGGFGQWYHGHLARRDGFDDAVFTDSEGSISETSIANIGFIRDGGVVWPSAPSLQGITMQLLEPGLAAAGISTQRVPVRLDELSAFEAAFVSNARGIAPVARIDDHVLAVEAEMMATLERVYDDVPWDAF